jgi:AcrR family transcriptional regulator
MASEKTRTLRKPRGQGPERRPEILAAAGRIFAARGYPAATMREVAREAGVSAPALYLYFENKETLLHAIAEEVFSGLEHEVRSAVSGGATPEDALRLGIAAYVAFGRAHPDAYRLVFMAKPSHAPRPGKRVEPGAPQRSFDILVQAVERLGAPRPPRAAAETLWAAMHGLTALMIDFPDVPEDGDDAAAVEALADMAIAWLRTA